MSSQNNVALQALSLTMNAVGDQGAAALAEALKVNSTLLVLEMVQCKIGNKGARAIGQALSVCSTFPKSIPSQSMVPFVIWEIVFLWGSYLQVNHGLGQLNLSFNRITNIDEIVSAIMVRLMSLCILWDDFG